MNHPIFLRTLKGENVFKIFDKLKAFNTQTIPNRKITLKKYECKKTLKSVPLKTIQQTYILTIIIDDPYVFLETKQLNSQKPSTFTLTQKQFLQKNFIKSLFNEIKEIHSRDYLVSGYQWEGFIIQFISIEEDLFFFILTNEMISPILKRQDLNQFHLKMRQGFEEILSRIINQKKAIELIQIYLQEIKKQKLFQNHPELFTNTEEKEKAINFNLIKYAKISQVNCEEAKVKQNEQKRDKSHSPMEIQK